MSQSTSDRREGPRVCIDRAAKVCPAGSSSFLAARTVNVSARGVLLEVEGERALEVGQEASVGIQWRDAGLLRADAMVSGRVLRCEEAAAAEPATRVRRVAIRLDESLVTAAVSTSRRAAA